MHDHIIAAMDADRAFARATRARARARLAARVRRRAADAHQLRVFDALRLVHTGASAAVNEIPLAAIAGTIEPGRAMLFDHCFRPARPARSRWLAVWMAERRGVVLPPISVVRVGNAYAVRDGHHRVSVALARGAVTIDAVVQ
jgi:hypothetical protein